MSFIRKTTELGQQSWLHWTDITAWLTLRALCQLKAKCSKTQYAEMAETVEMRERMNKPSYWWAVLTEGTRPRQETLAETPFRPLLSGLLTSSCGLACDQDPPGPGGPPTSSPPDQWILSGTFVILAWDILRSEPREMPRMNPVQTAAAEWYHVGSFFLKPITSPLHGHWSSLFQVLKKIASS